MSTNSARGVKSGLAWKLAMVLQEQASPTLLDTYESERKPIGAQVIEAASQIHTLFMAGRGGGQEEFEQMQASGFAERLIGRVSGLAYHYRPEALLDVEGLCPGDRAPDVRLGEDGQLFDLLGHGGHTLIARDALTKECRQSEWLSALSESGWLRIIEGARLTSPYEAYAYVLIRPDGYVASLSHDVSQLSASLERLVS